MFVLILSSRHPNCQLNKLYLPSIIVKPFIQNWRGSLVSIVLYVFIILFLEQTYISQESYSRYFLYLFVLFSCKLCEPRYKILSTFEQSVSSHGDLPLMKIFLPPPLTYRICPSIKKIRACLWTWIFDICTWFVVRAPGCTFCWIMICIWYSSTFEIPIQIAN